MRQAQRLGVWISALSMLLVTAARGQDSSSDKASAAQTALAALFLDYGVPATPAFELLPDKPSQVTHPTTPKDVASNLATWFQGSKINSAMGLDIRPLAGFAGSLEKYQASEISQLLWRAVLSAGTAKRDTTSSDVLIAVGLRIPILDRGDPRADRNYVKALEDAYLTAVGPPPFEPMSAESLAARQKKGSAAADSVRRKHIRDSWNAMRLDIGLAGSMVARSASTARDSVRSDRGGFWVGGSYGLGAIAAFDVTAKLSWARADQDTSENARHLVGANVRVFPTDWLAASAEVAKNWSRHAVDSLNESWTHVALGFEVKVPVLNGWVDVGYGGDVGRRGGHQGSLTLKYAFFQDRRMKQ